MVFVSLSFLTDCVRLQTLKAGELVITGAIAVTAGCKAGDHVVVSYEGVGEVSCTLAGMALTAAL